MTRIFNLILLVTILFICLIGYIIHFSFFQPESSSHHNSYPDVYKESKIEGFHTADLGAFKIDIPKNLKYKKQDCIDCIYGTFEGIDYELKFKYQIGNSNFNEVDVTTHFISNDTINGKPARVIFPRDRSRFNYIRINFLNFNNKGNLSFLFSNWSNLDTASLILSSIRKQDDFYFKNQIGLNESESHLNIYSGYSLFKRDCKICHSVYKWSVGPPLNDILKIKGKDWMINYATNSDQLISQEKRDSLQENSIGYYNHQLQLSDENLEKLLDYIEDPSVP